jgi:hypothetical protein
MSQADRQAKHQSKKILDVFVDVLDVSPPVSGSALPVPEAHFQL